MEQKICLDTDICISIMTGKKETKSFHEKSESTSFAVSSVTFFELLAGAKKPQEVFDFLNGIQVIEFDEFSARIASSIYKTLKSSGQIIEFRDIFIASCAISRSLPLATLNKKHFSRIKELKMAEI